MTETRAKSAGEDRGEVDPQRVRAHYARLAPEYERRANPACQAAYAELASDFLGGCRRVLEVGAGSSPLVSALPAGLRAACDASPEMLRAVAAPGRIARIGADALRLPFRDGSFDGVVSINLLEHVADPARMLVELHRVLADGGRGLLVTPNGDVERLLDLLERFGLKLPEGPHRFLGGREAVTLARARFRVEEHRLFLVFPVGPRWLVRSLDRAAALGGERGLFQYLLLRK